MYSEADVAAANVKEAVDRKIDQLEKLVIRLDSDLQSVVDYANLLGDILDAVLDDVYGEDGLATPPGVTEAIKRYKRLQKSRSETGQ